jgi:hypothetical protein
MEIMIIGIVVVVLILWLLSPSSGGEIRRCTKCGFTTYNEVEAAGHEALENKHKVVKE